MADIGRHVLWERLGGDALFAKIIQLLNDGWLSKSIGHFERSSSLFNYGGNLEGYITSKNPSPKGENLYLLQISLTMKYGGNSSRQKAILKSCFRQIGRTSPLGIGYTTKSSKEGLKTR